MSETETPCPSLRWITGPGRSAAVVLLLHGGRVMSGRRVSRCALAHLRMLALGRRIGRERVSCGLAIGVLRNRYRGWNEPGRDAIADARWAIGEARRRHPEIPLILVGHSMGGRVALRLAGAPGVRAVCALAPWIEPGEPSTQLAGCRVLIAHGNRDSWTDPAASQRYAQHAGVPWIVIPGSGHAMLRRGRWWLTVIRHFIEDAITSAAERLECG
ncbi:alpha/beta family hydrolase [Sciscionella sediminilitoris]|uniref:alpha/beta family hydrolase n=1 Tax=Sciscionella sediminilitoris TaxID=1445613 RepID=UPI001E2892ED|nr:alpha/beta family hydrolase [Sciscionella sp. SE31]